MDEAKARELLTTERAEVMRLLAGTQRAAEEDRVTENEPGAVADAAQPLTAEGVDDAIAGTLSDRLAVLDRALQRLENGSYGKSVRSGEPIPGERLAADPAAELTIEEARSAG
ncbi:MAG: TraR/DksA family transcriptional regulator [Streptosporangiaceae bacterium]